MNRIPVLSLLLIGLVVPLHAQKATVGRVGSAGGEVSPVPATSPITESRGTTILYEPNDIVRLRTKVRYTTLIVLPAHERILDFVCGDKEFWAVGGSENIAYVKPAKPGIQTNLNLITASGAIYSFLLEEASGSETHLDLKIFITSETAMAEVAAAGPRFVSVDQVEDFRQQVQLAKEETRQVQESAQAAIDRGIDQFVLRLRFPYRFDSDTKPFFVRAMYTDGTLTFIQAQPEELPALYELQDGKSNLVPFRFENGMYVVGKVLDQGYLAIGKQRLLFRREN